MAFLSAIGTFLFGYLVGISLVASGFILYDILS